MRGFLRNVVYTLLIMAGIAWFILACWGINEDGKRDQLHNAEQIAECHRLGGFARTSDEGVLIECTFPAAR